MKCEECQSILLDSLVDDESSGTLAPDASAHLEECKVCQAWWREVQGASEWLEKVTPDSVAAPRFEDVWQRVGSASHRMPKRPWNLRWLLDSLEVLAAAAVVGVVVYGLHLVTAVVAADIAVLPDSVLSVIQNPTSFAGIMALLGMLVGACAAPLFLKEQNGYARR
jgi:predicted anti-sigma-YlaC factor YlaD